MADDYIQDPELLKQLNEGYVTDPAILNALNAPETVGETLAAPKSWWTSPTVPPSDSGLQRIGESTAIGAGIGAAVGAPTGVGIVPGAIGGGISGLFSGVAGEIARKQGAPEPVILASEFAGGSVPSILKNIAAKGLSSIPYRGKVLAGFFETPQVEAKVSGLTKDILFGKKALPTGYNVDNSLETQTALRQQYLGESLDTLGDISPDKKVSDILREKLYSGLQSAREKEIVSATKTPVTRDVMGVVTGGGKTVITRDQNAFIRSPEYKGLMQDLTTLEERDMLDGTSLASLKKILSEEFSTNPAVKEKASQDILNLIQNGGVYTVGKKGAELETKTKINEATRKVLKERFDAYLERNMGSKAYSNLKAAEAAEFTAQARDEIPMIIQSKFKYGSSEMNDVLNSIKNSPEGKQDFATAVMQHLRGFDTEKEMMSEFSRLRPALKEAGVFDNQQISTIYNKIKSYEKIKDTGMRFKNIQNAITFPLTGVLGSQGANSRKSNPLEAFNL